MTNSNRIKLTWISFLSYALTGALVIVTGMVMGNIADYFQLPVSSMSNTFTFLNAGILISIFLNAWLMEIIPLKTQLRFGFILMVLAVAGLMFSTAWRCSQRRCLCWGWSAGSPCRLAPS